MSAYESLAQWYDRLTEDVDYSVWADWLEVHFAGGKIPVSSVLDLACGTGSILCELFERGYDVVGVDMSEEMLMQAAMKAQSLSDDKMPLLICQQMQSLSLYMQFDACVCCLDSINYITQASHVQRVFRRVFDHLKSGGRFIFDIHTPEKLERLGGQTFLDEDEDVYCVWRADYDRRTRICSYGFDLFQREGDLWRREEEYHEEKAWQIDQIKKWLTNAGFKNIHLYGNMLMRKPIAGDDRVYIVAEKPLS